MDSSDLTITIMEVEPATPSNSVASVETPKVIHTKCPVCQCEEVNVRKLKTHILLKHPELNLCLFCVEKKGWSDTFVSQSHYNQHYKKCHQGSIAKKPKNLPRKRKGGANDVENPSETPIKKNPPKIICFVCSSRPTFQSGVEYDRHMIAIHSHDYCKTCNLIGPAPAVRYHILDQHQDQLCHVCCSQSPVFNSEGVLRRHLIQRHGFKKSDAAILMYPCYDCHSTFSNFKTSTEFQSHLLESHLTKGDILKPMRKKRFKLNKRGPDTESGQNPQNHQHSLKKVSPIRNESGSDCFAICILHLLAQTDILSHLQLLENHAQCKEATCLLAHFLEKYRTSKRPSIQEISCNYPNFGIEQLPVDCGDFLRECFNVLSHTNQKDHALGESRIASHFQISLQWKFECQKCKRFMVTSWQNNLLELDGSEPGSFQTLLENFLHRKTCKCGNICEVIPRVKAAGKFIFAEINRVKKDSSSGLESKELELYSLQLEHTYNIFGFQYVVFASVNYNLEAEDGGHYVTNLFENSSECVRIHEDDWKIVRKKPDFDCDTVIVALQKVEMTADNSKQIQLEISYDDTADEERQEKPEKPKPK